MRMAPGDGIGKMDDLLTSVMKIFTGGSTSAIVKLILLTATVFMAWRVQRFLKNRAFDLSQKQAHTDRSKMISDNQSKDSAQGRDLKSLDKWRDEVRDGRSS